MKSRIIIPSLFAFLLAGCSSAPQPETFDSLQEWRAPLGHDHPLIGALYDPVAGAPITHGALLARLAQADFVLIGEKHDNPDHHRIQAWAIRAMTDAGRPPAVAFEMFTEDQQPAIDAYVARYGPDAEGLGAAVDWDSSGWPDWSIYQPVAQAGLDGGGAVLAASFPKAALRAIMKQGSAAIDPERVERLDLETELPAPIIADMRVDIIESHCNMLPDSMIDPMVNVLRTRDALMARVMIDAVEAGGASAAVLIAGGGHTRTDRGVPWHLRRMAAEAKILAIGLIEVSGDASDPMSYGAPFGTARPPYDVVWFTSKLTEEDPCAVHAEQLRKARERHNQNKNGE